MALERIRNAGPGEVVPGFGGIFVDMNDNAIVYVYLLDPSNQQAAEEAARIVRQGRAFREVRALPGRYAWGELLPWYNAMRNRVWAIRGLQSTDIDEKANRIRLQYGPIPGIRSEVEAALKAEDIPLEAVLIDVGCPVGQKYIPLSVPTNSVLRSLQVRVEMVPSPDARAGQPVSFKGAIRNTSPDTMRFEYGLATQFLVTRPDDSVVWSSLCGRGAIDSVGKLVTLAPGEELTTDREPTLAATWEQWDN